MRKIFLSLLLLCAVAAVGQQYTIPGGIFGTGTVINSSNGTLNATFMLRDSIGIPAILVQLNQTTTITAGAIKFQISYDATNFIDIPADQVIDPTSTTQAQIAMPYTLQATTQKPFLLIMRGARTLRLFVSTAMTGTGTITPVFTLLPTFNMVSIDAPLPTGGNIIGEVNVPGSSASGDAISACNILSAASTNATNCKNAAGNFYGYEIYNTTTTVYYLRLYNLSSSPTCSSATGFVRTIPIPPGGASGQVGGAISNQAFPTNYSTGLGYCITGGSGSTDNTNAATGMFGEIRYK